MENSSLKLLWDFTIQTDCHLPHNRPDIVYVSHQDNTTFLIDVAISGDNRLTQKINKKWQKYTDLKMELQRMLNLGSVCVL